ncbi:MAG: vWA domain-containing protein [Acidimicrobiales bacterium]
MATMVEIANAFVRRLGAEGIPVSLSRSALYLDALECLGIDELDDVYWAGRASLIGRPEDIPTYDRCFDQYFRRRHVAPTPIARREETTIVLVDSEEDPPASDEDDAEEREVDSVVSLRFSKVETLRERDFGLLDAAERAECARVMAAFRFAPPRRPSSRYVRSRRRRELDLRRTIRTALAREGEPIEQRYRTKGERIRRIVFICDISGSMETYAKQLIRFVHAALLGTRRVEVFTLGTRLTRITRELSNLDTDRALGAASAKVADWSGGTRLGEGIKAFNDRYGARGMARGATVVILSDGWDRGEPELLGTEMARLARVAHRVVWVNPLKASPGYAPLARGMAAALPYVDEFVEGHSLRSLEDLAEVIAK